MRRLVAIFLLLTVACAAGAQRVPDNDEILAAISDGDSPHYYPSLMLRYEAGDTTLTLDDYHYLYYGYAFQEAYKPLEPIKGEAELLMVLEHDPEPNEVEAAAMMRYARQVMEADPFSPKNINFMAYASLCMGDTLQARINSDRLDKVINTILSSGTGQKENSPWHVLWFSHATDVIGTMGHQINMRTVRTRTVEYVEVVRHSKDDPKGFFFDFGRVYWRKPDGPPRQKRVTGFEINGIPVGKGHNTDTPNR